MRRVRRPALRLARRGQSRMSTKLRLVQEGAPSSAGPGAAAGPEIEAPRFDPRGADFAEWVAAFKVTVGQQWRLIEDAAAGKVDVEFVVERDGSMSAMRVVESSGNLSLDQAAVSALGSSRFLPLPEAYPSENVMMRVSLVRGGGTN